MAMSRKDYVMIAQAIRAELLLCDDEQQVWAIEALRDRLATALSEANHRFNVTRFKDACEV